MLHADKLSFSAESNSPRLRSGLIGSGGRPRSYFGAAIAACGFVLGASGFIATASGMDHVGFEQGARMAVVQFAVARTLDSLGASFAQEAEAHDIVAAKFAKVVAGLDQFQALRERAIGVVAAPSFDRDAIEKLRAEAVARLDVESKLAMGALADIADLLEPEQRAQLAAQLGDAHPMEGRPPGVPGVGYDKD